MKFAYLKHCTGNDLKYDIMSSYKNIIFRRPCKLLFCK